MLDKEFPNMFIAQNLTTFKYETYIAYCYQKLPHILQQRMWWDHALSIQIGLTDNKLLPV